MLLICADVAGRSLFGSPIAGVTEMVSLSIVGIVFLQLASALRAGRLTRADLLTKRLGARTPRLAHALELLWNLTGALVVLVLVRASFPRFLTALQRDEFIGVVGHFTAPTWPVKLVLVVGAGALVLQFAVCAAESYRSMRRPPARESDDGP